MFSLVWIHSMGCPLALGSFLEVGVVTLRKRPCEARPLFVSFGSNACLLSFESAFSEYRQGSVGEDEFLHATGAISGVTFERGLVPYPFIRACACFRVHVGM